MFFLVCRKDAVDRTITNSQMWPAIVEAPTSTSAEDIILNYMEKRYPGYVGKHEYLVVPMMDARIVSFRPKRDWDVNVRHFDEGYAEANYGTRR